VVRLADGLVAKYGTGVRREEANNQTFAYYNVDESILRVPRVFRFFEDTSQGSRVGYLIMEYIAGRRLDSIDLDCNPQVMLDVAKAVLHLTTLPVPRNQPPGPVGGGVAYGYLWSDEGAQAPFDSVEDMQEWMNKRLAVVSRERLNIKPYKLVMCHMDLVRRNTVLLADTSICFLDWAYAGFFPQVFEICYI
ncbi:hypothetical protein BU26DRAFT_385176, partial [Trematosphaeria pertusa]